MIHLTGSNPEMVIRTITQHIKHGAFKHAKFTLTRQGSVYYINGHPQRNINHACVTIREILK